MRLSWIDEAHNEEVFLLERSENGGSSWSAPVLLDASAETGRAVVYQDTGLAPGSSYTYRVRAAHTHLSSEAEGPVSITLTPPIAPNGLRALSTSTTRLTLVFNDRALNEQGFLLQQSTDGGATYPVSRAIGAKSGTGTVNIVQGGLAPATSYTFRVRAYNGAGNSAFAGPASGGTQAPPAAPSGLALTVLSPTSVRAQWTDNAANEQGFKLERSADGGATYPTVVNVPLKTGTGVPVSATVRGLTPGAAYTFRARTYNDTTYSEYAGPKAVTLPAPPAAPTGLAVEVLSTTRLRLTRTDNAPDEQGFLVQQSTNGGSTYPTSRAVGAKAGTGLVSLTLSALSPATTYTFRVRAYNAAGSSAFEGPQSGMTQTAPAAPSGLTLTALSSTRIQARWTDHAANEQGFRLEVSTDGGTTYPTVLNVPSEAGTGALVTFNHAGRTPGTVYTYRVRAYNDGTYSGYAGPLSVIP